MHIPWLAGELYVRPPNVIVATAMQRCTRGDWDEAEHLWADHLTWLSVYNKMDYARLHGTTLHMNAIWVSVRQLDKVFGGCRPSDWS